VPISFTNIIRRGANGAAASFLLLAALIILTSCGDVYRPVAIPITSPGGDPQPTHFAIVLNKGNPTSTTPITPTASVFDVSGDSNMGNREAGLNPVTAIIDPGSRAWVVNQGTGSTDDSSVTTFFPQVQSLSTATVSLDPNAGAIAIDATSLLAFVTEANLNKLAIISSSTSAVRSFVPVGNNPVAVVTRPDGAKVYVANKNDNTVTVVAVADNAVSGLPISVGSSPVAMAMQSDGAFAYVASQGSGTLSVIDTGSDSEVQRLSGLSSPQQVIWDEHLKRVYVMNTGSISVFNAATPGNLSLLRTVPTSAAPIGLAVLDNGSKFYVLYAGTPGKVDVFDAQSFALRTTLTAQNNPLSIAAAPQSSKVYVVNSTGDAGAATPSFPNGSISIITTANDTVLNVASGTANPFFVTMR
jgi:YVTN family beta-propeller protein